MCSSDLEQLQDGCFLRGIKPQALALGVFEKAPQEDIIAVVLAPWNQIIKRAWHLGHCSCRGRTLEELSLRFATALALIEKLPSPVFVHRKYGCDRAGTIVACHRTTPRLTMAPCQSPLSLESPCARGGIPASAHWIGAFCATACLRRL